MIDNLSHHGVKGQRWGVRRDRQSGGSGVKEPAHEDALKAQATRIKAKSSGTKSLSNKEIQDFLTRANLETQFSRSTASTAKKGANFVSSVIANIGKQKVRKLADTFEIDKTGFSLG